ncbi:MAG: LysM peptidoglycan-binding domain-containing protein [Edaphocola sp.]
MSLAKLYKFFPLFSHLCLKRKHLGIHYPNAFFNPQKILSLFAFACIAVCSHHAQAQDTLQLAKSNDRFFLMHNVKKGENIFMLAKRYSAPAAVLADVNQVNYKDGLPPGTQLKIPIDAYNYIRVGGISGSRAIYYKTKKGDNLANIAQTIGSTQIALQRLNNLASQELPGGKTVMLGWIAYDDAQIPIAATDTPAIPATNGAAKTLPNNAATPDTSTAHSSAPAIPSAYEQDFLNQTNGMSLREETGAAVFYPLKTKMPEGIYYAFHNTAARGTIIKVANPATGRTIYAKVISTIPTLSDYHNSIVGISSNAAAALGAHDKRMFCKLSFP